MTRKTAVKLGFYVLILLGLSLVCALIYSYRHGGRDNFRPPDKTALSSKDQVTGDLMAISRAVETYYVRNLSYPSNLSLLRPDYLTDIPVEPVAGKPYLYQTDGVRTYRVRSSDPTQYSLQELYLENGKLYQK